MKEVLCRPKYVYKESDMEGGDNVTVFKQDYNKTLSKTTHSHGTEGCPYFKGFCYLSLKIVYQVSRPPILSLMEGRD